MLKLGTLAKSSLLISIAAQGLVHELLIPMLDLLFVHSPAILFDSNNPDCLARSLSTPNIPCPAYGACSSSTYIQDTMSYMRSLLLLIKGEHVSLQQASMYI